MAGKLRGHRIRTRTKVFAAFHPLRPTPIRRPVTTALPRRLPAPRMHGVNSRVNRRSGGTPTTTTVLRMSVSLSVVTTTSGHAGSAAHIVERDHEARRHRLVGIDEDPLAPLQQRRHGVVRDPHDERLRTVVHAQRSTTPPAPLPWNTNRAARRRPTQSPSTTSSGISPACPLAGKLTCRPFEQSTCPLVEKSTCSQI